MDAIRLNDNLKLSFESLPHAVKIIVSKDDEEWVCHKEKLKNLFSFLEMDIAHLFKGRLQLFKLGDRIDIQVKNIIIGSISKKTFVEVLRKK